jgi:hypothetical protein
LDSQKHEDGRLFHIIFLCFSPAVIDPPMPD